jgi:hypothetical protein
MVAHHRTSTRLAIIIIIIIMVSWGSVFGIATRYGMDCVGFDFRQRQEIFLFSKTSRLAVRPTQLPVKWVPGLIHVSKAAEA